MGRVMGLKVSCLEDYVDTYIQPLVSFPKSHHPYDIYQIKVAVIKSRQIRHSWKESSALLKSQYQLTDRSQTALL